VCSWLSSPTIIAFGHVARLSEEKKHEEGQDARVTLRGPGRRRSIIRLSVGECPTDEEIPSDEPSRQRNHDPVKTRATRRIVLAGDGSTSDFATFVVITMRSSIHRRYHMARIGVTRAANVQTPPNLGAGLPKARDQVIADFRRVISIASQFIVQHPILDHHSIDKT